MKLPNGCNLPALLALIHTIATTATTTITTITTDADPLMPLTLTPRSHPASLPICTGPWPPIVQPDHLFLPLLDADIDLRSSPSLVAFCTAPRPAACHCAFDDRTRRWDVRCDYNAVPAAHAWGFLYAIQYCERWCACVGPDGLGGLLMAAGRAGGENVGDG